MKKNEDDKKKTQWLIDHAINQMKRLSVQAISVDEAKAQANLIKQSNNLLKYELDKAIAIQKYDGIEINELD